METWLIPIVEKIAEKHGTNPMEVYRDMQAAVDAAHRTQASAANSFPNPPQPEDFIRFCAVQLCHTR